MAICPGTLPAAGRVARTRRRLYRAGDTAHAAPAVVAAQVALRRSLQHSVLLLTAL